MPDRENVQQAFTPVESKDNPVSTHAEFKPTFELAAQRFAEGWIFGEAIERGTNRALYARGQVANHFPSSSPDDDPVTRH